MMQSAQLSHIWPPMETHSGLGLARGVGSEGSWPITYRLGASKVQSTTWVRSVANPPILEDLHDIPRSNVDTIDFLRLGEREGEGKESEEVCNQGQKASHFDRK